MNELALFAGAGGGILGGKLLGWKTICAVEYNAYARSVLLARQNDGTLAPFPIWDDVRTFDGKPWGGMLTWFLAASPARTLAQPAKVTESTASEADSGVRWQGSFARYSPDSSLWKTAQCSLLADSDEFLETWPRWGSMRNGASYLRPTPALPICESESGLWPTPTCDSATERSSKYAQGGTPLTLAVKLWPTPTVCGNYNQKGMSKNSGDGLATAVRNWPTPVASMSKGSSPASLTRKTGVSRENDRLDHAVMASDGGQLNPNWVEWLMGWPIGWTDLKPLAMGRFQEWLQHHGGF